MAQLEITHLLGEAGQWQQSNNPSTAASVKVWPFIYHGNQEVMGTIDLIPS